MNAAFGTATEIRGTRRSGQLLLACVVGALGILTLTAAPASASREYDSQISGFSSPHAVAIDGSDDVWVSDPGNGGLISEHNAYPSQTQIGQQTGGGHFGANYIWSIGLHNSTGYLYVADSGPVVVDIFDDTGAFSQQFSHNFGGGYDYVAVDNSSGASNGRFYVAASGANSVQAFDSDNNPFIFSGSAPYINANAISGTPSGPFSTPWNIATDAVGNIYVVDQGKREVDEFDSSGVFVRSFDGSGAPGGFSTNISGVAIDPTNGDVLVVDTGNGVVDEFESSGTYVDRMVGTGPAEATTFTSLPGGIAVNSAGYVYVVDGGGNVDIYTPDALLPKVTYGAVTNQTQTSGTVNASVDLNGGPEVTACSFQYGTTTAYGSSAPCSPSTPYTANTAASANLSGLTTETPYHYRIVLTTTNGIKKGLDQTFLPHAVAGLTTEPATNVARNSATLNASFNGDGEDVHYFFEWGTSAGYGKTTTAPPGADEGAVSGPHGLHFDLSGLTVETTYHFRIVASNAAGTSHGADQTFSTPAAVENLSTTPATNLTASSATLNGSYTGIGENVHYYFEWGTDTSYGHQTAVPPGVDNGSPSGAQTLSVPLPYLKFNTVYHFRVVATDAAGTTHGGDRSFTTLGRYQFLTHYGSAGSGDGQFNSPMDVAVDNASGDIYVADTGNHRIVKLDSSGAFVRAWGWGVSDGNASAESCTSGCQAGLAGSGAGQFTTPQFVEVDNSNGPSAGDVYVADTNDSVVQKFYPSGSLLTSWGPGGSIDLSSPGGTIGGITVDATGHLFVVTDNPPWAWARIGQDGVSRTSVPTNGSYNGGAMNDLGPPNGTGIDVNSVGVWYELQQPGVGGVAYSSPNAEVYATGRLYSSTTPNPVNSGMVIDRASDDVYVDQGGYIDQFEGGVKCAGLELGDYGCAPSDTFGTGALNSAAGLGFDPSTGTVYAANAGGNNLALFTPLPVPDVTTGSVTNPSPTSGTLTGHVDPGSPGAISDCHFEYGTDTTYGLGSVPCAPAAPLSSPTDVSAEITGLSSLTTYHYRLAASRADGNGFPAYGADRTFTPAQGGSPMVDGSSFSGLESTGVTLSASINPNLSPTVYRFQYGTDANYGAQTAGSAPIGSDGVSHPVSTPLSGLKPTTTYHFRVVAVNFHGTAYGPDQVFSTPDLPTVTGGPASALTQTVATVAAKIRPAFLPTTYHFEYGTTAAYSSATPESGPVGSDNVFHQVTADLSGLSAGTAYHYRVVATNAIGSAAGPDQTFITASPPALPTPAKCKANRVLRHGKCVKRSHHKRKKKGKHHMRSAR